MDFKRQTYSTQVSQFIRTLIQTAVLKPGDQVKEVVLSQELGISRAPIREALQILVQDGLIAAEPQKGKTVRRLSPHEVLNGYAVSGILEGAAVATSLEKWTQTDMDNLQDILDMIEVRSKKSHDLEKMAELDDIFHDALLTHCDNEQLVVTARLSSSNISKFLCYQHWKNSCTPKEFFTRHQELAQVVLKKDKPHVEKLIRSHYQEVAAYVSHAIEKENGKIYGRNKNKENK